MAFLINSTKNIAVNGVKILVYGQAGTGKTTLIKTLPDPLILSAESGLLSLQGLDLPYIEIDTLEALQEVYTWLLKSEEAKKYKSIALDSISEIAEVVLSAEKQNSKDPRQAYGAMYDRMNAIIRCFRDLEGKHIYFSAKVEKSQDDTGRTLFAPSMPGQKIGAALPYSFDEVLALRIAQDKDGNYQRILMTAGDGLWTAKDRSGKLDTWEAPDLGAIIKKIEGETGNA